MHPAIADQPQPQGLALHLGDHPDLIAEVEGETLRLWLVGDGGVHASAVVTTEPPD